MKLTQTEVREIVERHFDAADVDTMTAICMAESGGETEAVNDNYPKWQPDPNSIYRYDYGLAQINSVHGFDAKKLLDDPDFNIECAQRIYGWQGFQAWSTFNAGAHLRYMPVPVVSLVPVPDPGDQPPATPITPVPFVERPPRFNVTDEDEVAALLNCLGNVDDYDMIGYTTHPDGRRRAIYTFRVLRPEDK